MLSTARHPARCIAPLLALVLAAFGPLLARPADAAAQEPGSDTEWVSIEPDAGTTCAVEGDYRFYARTASTDSIVVYLYGGGGCWNAELCVPETDSIYESEPPPSPARWSGIFDLDNPENPVRSHSIITVPYCTGDVHLGDRDATYTLEEAGETRTYTIHHRGLVNGQAVLDWVYENFPDPDQVLVAGSSAGAVATPFYANIVARHYADARVLGLADAAGAYRGEMMANVEPERWGIPDVLRRYPGWEAMDSATFGTDQLFRLAALDPPNLELYQFDQAHDEVQQRYLELAHAPQTDPLPLLRLNRRDIRAVDPDFRSFTVGGRVHTTLGTPRMYFYQADGRLFRVWLADIVAARPVESHWCDDCDRPELLYQARDLAIAERTLEILDTPRAWDRHDQGECATPPEPVSLACALGAAADQHGLSLGQTPVVYDVLHAVLERTPDLDMAERPLVTYNNEGDTTFEDIRSLLLEVRDHVARELSATVPPGDSP